MAIDLGRLRILVGADLSDVTKKLKTLGEKMNQVGEKMQSAGLKLTAGLTVPLAAVGGAAFKLTADFDKAMAQSTAIMSGMTTQVRAEMEEVARTLSTEGTRSAKELADAYFYLASAGLDVEQSMSALQAVQSFSIAGQFDMSRATDLLTDAQSALGLTVKDAAKNYENMVHVSDVLVKANTMANASVEQFSESLTNRAGSALRLLNKDMEEGIAILSVFADQGVKGAEAGTRMDIALRNLAKVAVDNRDKFKWFHQAVFDSTGTMRNVADIIEVLEDRFSGMSDEMRRTTIQQLGFADRSVQALLQLIGFSDALRDYETAARSAGGITEKVAQNQMKNMSDRLVILKNRAADVAISLGKALTPAFKGVFDILERVVDNVGDAVSWFAKLPTPIKSATVALAALAAAAGPVLLAIGTFVKLSGVFVAGLAKIGAMFTWLAAHPIIAAVVALTSLGAWLLLTKSRSKEAETGIREFGSELERLEASAQKARNGLDEAFGKKAAKQLEINRLKKEAEELRERLSQIYAIEPPDAAALEGPMNVLKALESGFDTFLDNTREKLRKTFGEDANKELERMMSGTATIRAGSPFAMEDGAFSEWFGQLEKWQDAIGEAQAAVDELRPPDANRLEASVKAIEKNIVVLEREVAAAEASAMKIAESADAKAELQLASANLEKTLKTEEKIFKTSGDEISLLTNKIAAYETWLNRVKQVIPEGDAELEKNIGTVKELREQLDKLVASTQDQGTATEQIEAIYENYEKTLANIADTVKVFGDHQEGQRLTMMATEEAIIAMIEAWREAGGVFDTLAEHPLFQNLIESMNAFREAADMEETAVGWEELFDRMGARMESFGEEDLMMLRGHIADWSEELALTLEDLGEMFTGLFDTFTQGFGNAVAQWLVYGANFAKVMAQLGKKLAASLISTVVKMGIELLAFYVLSLLGLAKKTAAEMAAAAQVTYAQAFASIIGPATTMFLFAGPAVAAGFADAAVGMMLAGAAASGALGQAAGAANFKGFAEGGITTAPTLALIGEAGPEAVLPLSKLHDFIPAAGSTYVYLEAEGETLAEVVVPAQAGMLREVIGRRAI